MKKVAIVQHSVHFGGRLSVLLSLMELLNGAGIVPDVISSSMPSSNSIASRYNRQVNFRLRKLPCVPLPSDIDILQLHLRSRPMLRSYDLIINSSNSNLFIPEDVPLILMVFFPRKYRALNEANSIHIPEIAPRSMSPMRIYKYFLRKLYDCENIPETAQVVAISKFTRDAVRQGFALPSSRLSVVYPPVNLAEFAPFKKKSYGVTTIGRFKPYKRQLEQIDVASRLPEIDFTMMGFVSSRFYYKRCRDFQKAQGAKNVRLVKDAPFSELRHQLEHSRIFMHNVVCEWRSSTREELRIQAGKSIKDRF